MIDLLLKFFVPLVKKPAGWVVVALILLLLVVSPTARRVVGLKTPAQANRRKKFRLTLSYETFGVSTRKRKQ